MLNLISPSQVRNRFHCRLVLCAFLGVILTREVGAQQGNRAKPPLVVINAASFERLLSQAVTTFEAAGRPELAETIGGGLARVNDLKGFNRSQSTGVMVFLNGLSPQTVAYVPVKSIDDLLKTIEVAPVSVRKTMENRYEITGGPQPIQVRIEGDYAFVSTDGTSLEQEFPDPVQNTRRLSNVYDLSAAINLRGLDPETRKLVFNIFKAQAENGLQRRDNEPESVWRLRQADGERTLALVELLLNQGEELLIGWSVSPVEKVAALEVILTATPGSEYATYFGEFKGVRSRFSSLVNTENPLAGSLSWVLDKPSKKSYRRMLQVAQKELLGNLAPDDENRDAEDHPVRQLINVFDQTLADGHIDFFAQMVGTPPDPFTLVGGLKVSDSNLLSTAVTDILGRLKERPEFSDVRLNYSMHQEIPIHRLETARDDAARDRVFGGKPAIYLSIADSVMWFAIGGDPAIVELKRAIDRAATPPPAGIDAVPLQFVMNFSRWNEIFDPGQNSSGFRELARQAFSKGNDALRIEVLPVTDGIRFRLQFDEAFLRLAGSAIARQMDERAEAE